MAKHLGSLRERLGLPPLSPQDAARLQSDVDTVMQGIIDNNPSLRDWVSRCRRTFDKQHCERDVFGDCACDRRPRPARIYC